MQGSSRCLPICPADLDHRRVKHCARLLRAVVPQNLSSADCGMASQLPISRERMFARKGKIGAAPRCWRELCQHEIEQLETLLRVGQPKPGPELRQRMA